MTPFLTLLSSGIFTALAALHLYWVMGGRAGLEAALPQFSGSSSSPGGSSVFRPPKVMTLLVALALLGAAGLVSLEGGFWSLSGLKDWVHGATLLLSGVLLARAVGEFRYVGFFKTVRDTRFGQLDTRFYSPLCLFLGLAVLWVALN